MPTKWFHRFWFIFPLIFFTLLTSQVQGQNAMTMDEKATNHIVLESEKKLNFGIDADFVTRYVWRGIALSDGAVFQPSGWLSFNDATFSVWGNLVLNDEPNQGQFNEVDFSLTYNYEYKRLIVHPMLFFYLYPNQDTPNSGEAALALGIKFGDFTLFTAQVFDFLASPGAYFGLIGASFEKELIKELSIKIVSGVGWANENFNDVNFDVSNAAANVVMGSVELNWFFYHGLYLRSHIKVTTLLAESLRNSVDDPTIISGGLAVGYEY